MEDTNLQELDKIENVTSREGFLRSSGRGCDLASEIVKIDETTREIVIFTHNTKSHTSAKEADSKKRVAQA